MVPIKDKIQKFVDDYPIVIRQKEVVVKGSMVKCSITYFRTQQLAEYARKISTNEASYTYETRTQASSSLSAHELKDLL